MGASPSVPTGILPGCLWDFADISSCTIFCSPSRIFAPQCQESRDCCSRHCKLLGPIDGWDFELVISPMEPYRIHLLGGSRYYDPRNICKWLRCWYMIKLQVVNDADLQKYATTAFCCRSSLIMVVTFTSPVHKISMLAPWCDMDGYG